MFHRAVRRPYGEFPHLLPENAKLTKHADHDEYKIDKPRGRVDGFGVFNKSYDHLSNAEIDRPPNHGSKECQDITNRREADTIDIVAGKEYDERYQQDHH